MRELLRYVSPTNLYIRLQKLIINSDDSVECAVCHNTYHMTCVRPPLLKKPSRGFAWACAPCSRAQERRLEARRTPIVGDATDAEEDEVVEEEEEDPAAMDTATGSFAGSPDDRVATDAEIAHAKMWPMRYLGIHCRVEDVLQYEDRAIYPRASSRLGPKHQANTLPWHGRPLELVKPVEIKKKYVKAAGNKKDTKLSKETQLAIEADKEAKSKRPPWVQDEPAGYLRRGEDLPNDDPKFSAKLLFKLPTIDELSSRGDDDAPLAPEELVDAYMTKAKAMAKDIGVESYSTDFLDRAIYLFRQNSFDSDAALKQLKKTNPVGKWPHTRLEIRKDLRDPRLILKEDEKKRFEDGVKKYGSELRLVRIHVRTISHADTVRYWYYWKKTPRGKMVWGSYGGRKNSSKKKTENTDAATKLLDDIADAQDDSAFDNEKIYNRTRKMTCKFCSVRRSRCWRRAPGVAPGQTVPADGRSRDKGSALVLALCQRCARLWRRYAIQWEDHDEMSKKISMGGGKAWKRRVDEELIKEWTIAQETPAEEPFDAGSLQAVPEPPRKKLKGPPTAEADIPAPSIEPATAKKKVFVPAPTPPPKEPTPPIIPAPPKMRSLPCAICYDSDTTSENLLSCRDCRLVVHRACYGVPDSKSGTKWSCDPCANDRRELSAHGSSLDPAAYVSLSCIATAVLSILTPYSVISVFYAQSSSLNRILWNLRRYHTRRKLIGNEKRNGWKRSLQISLQRIIANTKRTEADLSYHENRLSVLPTISGYTSRALFGHPKSNTVTPSSWSLLREYPSFQGHDENRSVNSARAQRELAYHAFIATQIFTSPVPSNMATHLASMLLR
jgi:hypothetical protein